MIKNTGFTGGGKPTYEVDGEFIEIVRKTLAAYMEDEDDWHKDSKDVDGNQYPHFDHYHAAKNILTEIEKSKQ